MVVILRSLVAQQALAQAEASSEEKLGERQKSCGGVTDRQVRSVVCNKQQQTKRQQRVERSVG